MDDGTSVFRKAMTNWWKKLKNRYAYYQWQKTFQIKKHLQNIEHIFHDVNGFELSYLEKKDQPNLSLTYGEIHLESFLALLSLAKPRPQQVFYDLGSGVGKTVIAASMVYGFQKAYGIETLKNLDAIAKNKQKNYAPHLNIEFVQQDVQDIDWHDADILFMNVASFVSDTWEALSKKLCEKPTPIMITCSKPLNHPRFSIQETKVLCSWGIVPAYIHINKTI
jgi:hypothetical protein